MPANDKKKDADSADKRNLAAVLAFCRCEVIN